MKTENIFSWLERIGFTELSPALQSVVAMIATLISEDGTLLALSLLKQAQSIEPWVFWFSGFMGIIIGDLLLYYMGYYLAQGKKRFLWLDLEKIQNTSNENEKSIFIALMCFQFLPGSRFPGYVAAGVSRYPVLLFTLSKVLVLPIWLFLFSVLGEVLLQFLHKNVWLASAFFLGLIFLYFSFSSFNKSLHYLSLKNRAKVFFYGLKKYKHFEFWPAWLFYIPVVFYIIYFTIRYRSGTMPTASNPSIEYGGWVGENKSLICDLISDDQSCKLKHAVIKAAVSDKLAKLNKLLSQSDMQYPFILKPEKGLRGAGVRLVQNEADATEYLSDVNFDVLLQEYCDYEYEAGIFYVRYPDSEESSIYSITDKNFPYAIGDGGSTLLELIFADERARMIAPVYFKRFIPMLNTVLKKGERLRLAEAGNHAQGVQFLNGMDTLYTPALHKAFDDVAHSINDFYIGRLDIRYKSVDAFRRGEDFKVIEINGAGAEATHIYDPKTPLLEAYKVLFKQYKMVYEIGAINHKKGVAIPSGIELLKVWWSYLKLSKNYQDAS